MPEDKPTTTRTMQEGRPVSGYRGSEAGKSYLSTAESNENEDWQAYKMEKKLGFAVQKKDHTAAFNKWREDRAKVAGRKKALAEPTPAPTPKP